MTDPVHVVLVGHGTVERLDDLPAFLANIRHGRPAPDSLVQQIRQHYLDIGGRSPLTDITRRVAGTLGARLGLPVHVASRLWHPFVRDVAREIVARGAREVVSVPMAQYSVPLYQRSVADALAAAASDAGVAPPRMHDGGYWHCEPALVDGYALALRGALDRWPAGDRASVQVVFSAHSLPQKTVEAGDPYPRLVEETARAVAERAGIENAWRLAFQSQGATADPWIGPDLVKTFHTLAAEGARDVLISPIGFLADHVEVLYDLDIEAQRLAREAGLARLERTASLNDSPRLLDALEAIVRRAIAG